MKKLMILCLILLFGSISIVNAQTAKGQKKTTELNNITPITVNKSNIMETVKLRPPVAGDIILEPTAAGQAKVGLHAPEPSDANYITKISEWIKSYPDEYKLYLKSQSDVAIKNLINY